MSLEQNTVYLENKMEEFQEILANKDWEKIQPFYIELEEMGFSKDVPAISQLMSDEDVKDYKRWDRDVNGDTETQMDDNA